MYTTILTTVFIITVSILSSVTTALVIFKKLNDHTCPTLDELQAKANNVPRHRHRMSSTSQKQISPKLSTAPPVSTAATTMVRPKKTINYPEPQRIEVIARPIALSTQQLIDATRLDLIDTRDIKTPRGSALPLPSSLLRRIPYHVNQSRK